MVAEMPKGQERGLEACMRRNTPGGGRKDTISIVSRANTGVPIEYLINLDSQREAESSHHQVQALAPALHDVRRRHI